MKEMKIMQFFIFNQWHAWTGNDCWLLSDEETKTLHSFAEFDDLTNWLFMNGHKAEASHFEAIRRKF